MYISFSVVIQNLLLPLNGNCRFPPISRSSVHLFHRIHGKIYQKKIVPGCRFSVLSTENIVGFIPWNLNKNIHPTFVAFFLNEINVTFIAIYSTVKPLVRGPRDFIFLLPNNTGDPHYFYTFVVVWFFFFLKSLSSGSKPYNVNLIVQICL